MGARNKLAVHQIPRVMKFTAEDMIASMDGAGRGHGAEADDSDTAAPLGGYGE